MLVGPRSTTAELLPNGQQTEIGSLFLFKGLQAKDLVEDQDLQYGQTLLVAKVFAGDLIYQKALY